MTPDDRAELVSAVLEALAPALKETNERLRALDAGIGHLLELTEEQRESIDDNSVRLARLSTSVAELKTAWDHCSEHIVGLNTVVHGYQQAVESTIDKTGAKMHARVERLERFLPETLKEEENGTAGAAGE